MGLCTSPFLASYILAICASDSARSASVAACQAALNPLRNEASNGADFIILCHSAVLAMYFSISACHAFSNTASLVSLFAMFCLAFFCNQFLFIQFIYLSPH